LSPAPWRALYGREEGTVEVLPYPAALAIKIVMDRMRGPTRNLPVPTHAFVTLRSLADAA